MANEDREWFTLEEVKAMAEAKGLPCEIRKIGGYKSGRKRVGMEIVTPQSTLEALGLDREWARYYRHDYAAQAARPAIIANA